MRIVFAADMHLQPGERPEQNRRLKDFLATLKRGDRLVLLGDAFHCFFERRGRCVGDYEEIWSAFHAASLRGIGMDHITGNRDFGVGGGSSHRGYLDDGYASVLCQAGIEPRGTRYVLHGAGQTIHALHGDTFCTADLGYQRLRRLMYSSLCRFVGRWAPFFLIALKVRAVQQTLPVQEILVPPDNRNIVLQAAAAEVAAGADLVVCGHVHHQQEHTLDAGGQRGRLVVVPPWMVEGYHAVLDDDGLRIQTMEEWDG